MLWRGGALYDMAHVVALRAVLWNFIQMKLLGFGMDGVLCFSVTDSIKYRIEGGVGFEVGVRLGDRLDVGVAVGLDVGLGGELASDSGTKSTMGSRWELELKSATESGTCTDWSRSQRRTRSRTRT